MPEYVDIINMSLNDQNLQPISGGFQSLPPGTYDFEISKQATGTSGKGNNILKITAKVVGPEGTPVLNRNMTCSYVIDDSDFARGRMLQLLQGCGAVIDQNGGFSRESLVGLHFTADVEKRPGNVIDKMGNESVTEFTSWVRERPQGTEFVPPGASSPQPQVVKAAQPVAQQSIPANAVRRPQAPNGNARPSR